MFCKSSILNYFKIGLIIAGLNVFGTTPVDFSTFTPSQYNSPTGFADVAQWTVSPTDSSFVSQDSSQNATASVFLSQDLGVNTRFEGRIVNTGPDDDYIGFVLGFSPGDHLNGAADFLLIDWRAAAQNNNFDGPGVGGAEVHSATIPPTTPANPSGNNKVGLALSRVTGRPTADEFWHHYDDPAVMSDAGAVTELVRANNFSNLGYTQVQNGFHDIQIDWLSDRVDFFVDGLLEISYSGPNIPTTGLLGMYQMYQEGVQYEAFESAEIPEPTTWVYLLLSGAGVIAASAFRGKKHRRNS